MSDSIDRQAALDAFNTDLNELVVGGEKNAKMVENYLNNVIKKIEGLPPVQPNNVLQDLAEEIATFKRSLKNMNSDYFMGYLDALSLVEVMIAERRVTE